MQLITDGIQTLILRTNRAKARLQKWMVNGHDSPKTMFDLTAMIVMD